MDTLTHALSGALVARATAPKDAAPFIIPRRVAAGFLTAAFPDIDFVISFLGPVPYLLNHRGVTHSLLALPLWALLLSWLLALMLRSPGGWRALYGVSALGLGIHIAGDVITSFGTMVFAPLSTWRAAIGSTFIIDLWFSGIILGGLMASLFWRSRVPAVIASLTLTAYIGFQLVLKEQALDFARDYAMVQGLQGATVDAQPRPVSPFNWAVFVSDEQAHRHAHINLRRKTPRILQPEDGFIASLDAPYQPLSQAQWERSSRYSDDPRIQPVVKAAWTSEALGFFRWFAALPAFHAISGGGECVWFRDLRFVQPGRAWVPFEYGACRDGSNNNWRAFQRLPEGGQAPI